jgi:hypothetical protein
MCPVRNVTYVSGRSDSDISEIARLWRAFSFSTKDFQPFQKNTFLTNELEEFWQKLRGVSKNSTAQNWHNAAQKFARETGFVRPKN